MKMQTLPIVPWIGGKHDGTEPMLAHPLGKLPAIT